VPRTGLWLQPDFLRLWSATTVSTFGSFLTQTALSFTAILVLGAGPFEIGLLAAAELGPAVLVGLFAGTLVDRWPRRPIMIASDLGRAILLGSIPIAALLGTITMLQLYVVAAAVSVLSVFFEIANRAFLPTLIARQALVEGNSKLTASTTAAETVAFGTGGWLVQWLSAPIAIVIDALSFVWSALLIARIRAVEPAPSTAEEHHSMRREIGDGLRAVLADPVLRALTGSNAILNLGYYIIGAAYLLYVNQALGFGPGVLGFIFAVGGAGAFAGSIVAERIPRAGAGLILIVSLLVTAAGMGLVPLATGTGLLAIALLVSQQIVGDLAATIYQIYHVSLRQSITPNRLLGRVSASIRVIEAAAMLLGSLVGGLLGETIGLRPTLVAGVVVIALAAVWLFGSPVRNLPRALPLADVVDDPAPPGQRAVSS